MPCLDFGKVFCSAHVALSKRLGTATMESMSSIDLDSSGRSVTKKLLK